MDRDRLNYKLVVIISLLCVLNVLIVITQYVNITKSVDDQLISVVDSIRELNDKLDLLYVCNIESIPEDMKFIENTTIDYLVTYSKYYTKEGVNNLEWMAHINSTLRTILSDDYISKDELDGINALKEFINMWLSKADTVIEENTGDFRLNKSVDDVIRELNEYKMTINRSDEVRLEGSEIHYQELVAYIHWMFKNYLGAPPISIEGSHINVLNKSTEFKLYDKYYMDFNEHYIIMYQLTKYKQRNDQDIITVKEIDAVAEQFTSGFKGLKKQKYSRLTKYKYNGYIYEYIKEGAEEHKPLLVYIDKYGYICSIYYPKGSNID